MDLQILSGLIFHIWTNVYIYIAIYYILSKSEMPCMIHRCLKGKCHANRLTPVTEEGVQICRNIFKL